MSNYAFEEMRPLQLDIIDKITAAFEDHKYVMLESPTGTGKSGIVMSIALQMKESYVNTSSKLLQDQYLRDFDFIKTVKGKSTFECINPERLAGLDSITCDAGACQFDSKYICTAKPKKEDFIVINRGTKQQSIMGPKNKCKYFEQKMMGFKAGHTIFNYAYFFSMYFYTDELTSRNLLVFDEAHNIENQILEFISLNPSPGRFEQFYKGITANVEFLKNNTTIPNYPKGDKVEDWIEYLKGSRSWMTDTLNYFEDKSTGENLKKTLSKLESLHKKVCHVITIMEQDSSNWVIDVKEKFGKVESVKISPIETGPYVKPIFEMGNKVLFASATLFDKEVFANMVGVPPNEIAFIRMDESPFPKENRPIHLMNTGEMNYKTMDSLMPKIVIEIDTILHKHINERGIIHCTSYKQLEYILNHSYYGCNGGYGDNRLIKTETGIAQSIALKKQSIKSNGVLISPSMHEGVDLKDDLSRFQITIKIPYMDLSDKRTMVKMRKSHNWYQWNAILKLIQGVGRSIRNENDYAVTYVLDSKVGQILQNKMVPNYIKEAIK